MPGWLAPFIMLVFLSGCALFKGADYSEPVAALPLATPIGPAKRVVQELTAQWAGRQETMLCVLELDKQHIAVAGLNKNGIGLFNLNYDGKKITLDKSPLLPEKISPVSIINDLQLVYWPFSELQKILPPRWQLQNEPNQRRFYYGNENFIDVDYLQPDPVWAKSVILTNHHYRYQLRIRTISYETVPE